MTKRKAIEACVFLEIVLLFLTVTVYALSPIAHSLRGLTTIVLLDVLIVFGMFYVAFPGLDKE